MPVNGIACFVAGHHWVPAAEFREAYPVFECARCGRSQSFAPGTTPAGYNQRLEARTGADKIFLGRGGRR